MIRKLLIANRGEIACRIIGTARRMGVRSVAVYSDADATARHVELADEAWHIGPPPARQSYLAVSAILDAARRSGADAIHPGYGFLSENADFAEACRAAGIIFVGPPADAIRAMGSKAEAKALMARAGVPLVPGYHEADQNETVLAAAAACIGYPVLIKASAGGGGKGMRIVRDSGEFAAALAGARGEARASFGDDRVLVEKYLTRPRHIEIQVFGDTHGNVHSLFERDCSIQRRHQKVLEEAPAPFMTAERRAAMGEAACAAARAVAYVGAGTVEFIAEGGEFFFMEMNTRLQVEHPVTEMITGLDLVEWQLRVASGEALPWLASDLRIAGHAIEARIYAEDPARDFLPSIGRLLHLRQPATGADVRVDTGVRGGDMITPYYDPMIAKLAVHGKDRVEALHRLQVALADYEVVGVPTNLDLLRAVAAHPRFVAGGMDTGFIAEHAAELMPAGAHLPDADRHVVLAAACVATLREETQAVDPADVDSPWAVNDAWRLNGDGYQDLILQIDGSTVATRAFPRPDGYRLEFPDRPGGVHVRQSGTLSRLEIDGVVRDLPVVRQGDAWVVVLAGRNHFVTPVNPLAPPKVEHAGDDRVVAPIPARVARILVRAGDVVAKGAPLIVLEAMKMELTLNAPIAGTVEAVRKGVDEMVREGESLVSFGIEERN